MQIAAIQFVIKGTVIVIVKSEAINDTIGSTLNIVVVGEGGHSCTVWNGINAEEKRLIAFKYGARESII